MAADQQRATYAGFLSYSHTRDRWVAQALQGALHRFAKPWYRMRAIRVFRDDASLAAEPLWPSIEAALDGSEFLILLANPHAAGRPYVEREVRHWCAAKPAERLLLVVTGGTLVWDHQAGDFDWERTTALPAALRGRFADEPRYVDLRWVHDEPDPSPDDPRLLDAVADLAATLHHRAKDELVGEDVRQHRRTRAAVRTAVAVLTALTLAATASAVAAVRSQRVAEAERDQARTQFRLAASRQLAAQAQLRAPTEPVLANLLSVAAFRTAPTAEARSNLLDRALQQWPPGMLPGGHTGWVGAAAFSPDGRILATAGKDRSVVLWDPIRRVRLATLVGHRDVVADLAFSPDGHVLASSARDGTIKLWDPVRRARLGTLHADRLVDELAFSRDGRILASAGRFAGVVLWNLARRARLASLVDGAGVEVFIADLAFSPDGRTLAIGGRTTSGGGRGVELWDLRRRTRRARLSGQVGSSGELAFSPDGRVLVQGGWLDEVTVWDVRRPTPLETLTDHNGVARDVAFSRHGQLAVATTRGTVVLWDADGWRRRETLASPTGPVQAIAFSPDGATLAAAGARGAAVWALGSGPPISTTLVPLGRRRTLTSISPDRGLVATAAGWKRPVRVWHVGDGTQVARFACPDEAEALAFSPDGRLLAAGCDSGDVVLWDLRRGAATGTLPGRRYTARVLDFSPDGRILATAGAGGAVQLWDVTRRAQLGRLPGHGDNVEALRFSPDGRTLAADGDPTAGGDDDVVLWDVRRRVRLGTAASYEASSSALAFSPDGRLLASAGHDNRSEADAIVVWDVEHARQVARLTGHDGSVDALAFSPDGRLLISGGDSFDLMAGQTRDGNLLLWEVATGARTILAGHTQRVRAVAFSPDGATLATAGSDEVVLLWDVSRRARIGALPTGCDVGTMAFSADSRQLVTAAPCGGLARWDLDPGSWQRLLCAAAGRELSEPEWRHFLPGLAYQRLCA